ATQRLAKMLNKLRNKQAAPSTSKNVDLGDIIKKVIEQRNIMQPQITFIMLNSCKITLDEEQFFSVMNHLLQNAQEATSADGWVKVNVDVHQHKIQVTVSDNGCGMSEEFIKTRLFKPFDTTKGNAGMGIGVFEAKQFFESVGGSLQVESIVGQGTKMIISLSR
ncbi:MAG: ATP-binding protein, partial [Colwellia sp.]